MRRYHNSVRLDDGRILDVNATHLANTILMEIRVDGAMDATLEVYQRGLSINSRQSQAVFCDDDELWNDPLTKFAVTVRLGDPNNASLPVVCSQLAEFYRNSILQTETPCNMIITMSSRLCGDSTDTKSFNKLMSAVSDMYKQP